MGLFYPKLFSRMGFDANTQFTVGQNEIGGEFGMLHLSTYIIYISNIYVSRNNSVVGVMILFSEWATGLVIQKEAKNIGTC